MNTITVNSAKFGDGHGTTAALSFVVPEQFKDVEIKLIFQGHHQHVESFAAAKLFISGNPLPIFDKQDSVFTDFDLGFAQVFQGYAPGETFHAQAQFRTNNVLNDSRFKLDLVAIVRTAD